MKIKSLDDVPAVQKYLKRIGAKPRSLKSAVVREKIGNYWKDVCVIRFAKDGLITCKEEDFQPTPAEADEIEKAFKDIEFPKLKRLPNIVNAPKEIKDASTEDMFVFRDVKGDIVMIQLKGIDKSGKKYYIPWTYWDDDIWRIAEPEGKLPLWGLDKIGDNTTVFIHEGAKAARAVHKMTQAKTADQKEKLKDHPWGLELSNAAHLGWVGGALAPTRTDWKILNRLDIRQVYIVSDNDKGGISVVPKIAQRLKIPTFHLQFTNEWPAAFDLADEFPDKMFRPLENRRRYVGPGFRSCLHPATWATDTYMGADEKVVVVLREIFEDMWAYIEESDLFVCKFMPNIVREGKILNNMLSAFSDTRDTCKLILQAYNGRTTGLCYRPDKSEMVLTHGASSSINLHLPSEIKAEPGDPKPFLDFMDYMFPIEMEREEVKRWLATIIARLDIRMEYGMLLISEATGIGKTTISSKILMPLIGAGNVGFPRESDIVNSDFNDWVANKRLVVVNEIYSGHSWKAYHSLKSLITDTELTVNQKYQRPYVVDNWCHIFACSNSMRALKMEGDDRRWFYPEVTEERWPKDKFGKFFDWLHSGGLGVIKTWANGFNNYVSQGERAPMTSRKKEMIEGSRSEAQIEAAVIAETISGIKHPVAIAMKDVVFTVRNSVQGKVFDSDYELRKGMVEGGLVVAPKRVRAAGRIQYILMNKALDKLVKNDQDHMIEIIQGKIKPIAELFEADI